MENWYTKSFFARELRSNKDDNSVELAEEEKMFGSKNEKENTVVPSRTTIEKILWHKGRRESFV